MLRDYLSNARSQETGIRVQTRRRSVKAQCHPSHWAVRSGCVRANRQGVQGEGPGEGAENFPPNEMAGDATLLVGDADLVTHSCSASAAP